MPILAADDPEALAAAARCLAAGGLVGMPTETVYGLAARADEAAAVAGIFRAKGRPSDHPLIVHVTGPEAATPFVAEGRLPVVAQRLMQAFWPGPLTLIVARRPGVAEAAAGGHDTIGLRCPAHPAAQALLRAAAALGVPGVAAPSANRFGRVSPTRAAHVAEELGPDLLVLDGGECPLGIESAIVDCSRQPPTLMRPGVLTQAQIEAAAGQPLRRAAEVVPAPDTGPAEDPTPAPIAGPPATPRTAGAAPASHPAAPAAATDLPRAPGMLASHYAPRARVRLWRAAALGQALRQRPPALCPPETAAQPAAGLAAGGLAVYSRLALAPGDLGQAAAAWHWQAMPGDARAAAHELFAVLRALDAHGVHEIWVEAPPDDPAWDGVRDRLQRAAAPGRPDDDAPAAPPARA